MTGARVLVVDDEASIRFVLRETIEAAGHEVTECSSGDAALEAIAEQDFEVAFFDIRMPGPSGLELLGQLRATGRRPAVVIMTALNSFENAVEAMKRGAFDYLLKPFSTDDIPALIERALRRRALENEVRGLKQSGGARQAASEERLVGSSPRMIEVFKIIGRVARTEVPVLITGESGTGKEEIARAIHAASARGDGAFITVNAAAIPSELLESELFGHEKGAFTGADVARAGRFRQASGGTLFLDEIGDMPVALQVKLLRVLQSGELTPVGGRQSEKVDVRIIAATHRDLDAALEAGAFREDLLYRLRVVPIEAPPLRAHREDIPLLVEHFLERHAADAGGARTLLPETLERLRAHDWPGNVRELENALRRALALCDAEVLTPEDFDFLRAETRTPETPPDDGVEQWVKSEALAALARGDTLDLQRTLLTRVERPLIETALRHCAGNQLRAAELLGINRNTLRKKITELGIEVPGRE